MRIEELQNAARCYTYSTGVETDGFHPKLLLDLTEEERTMNIHTEESEAVWVVARTS